MRRLTPWIALILVLAAALRPIPALAQNYSFSLDRETVDVYWESDGSMRIDYTLALTNDLSGSPMDFIDVGMPNASYDLGSISGTINGQPISHIAPSQYVNPGIELGLGSMAIQPGASGSVRVSIGRVTNVLYPASDQGYVSAVFAPSFFDSQYVHGSTDVTVTFILPPGVRPEEPHWYASPSGWSMQAPSTGLTSDGRIIYQWHEANANAYTSYEFGASFPASYVPTGAVSQPSLTQQLGVSTAAVTPCLCVGGFLALMVAWIFIAVRMGQRRKLAYLPPKIAIEGHGIKRGLTAVEAAVLLETPLDRVLSMILFGVIKKNAAQVVQEEPLVVEKVTPQPEGIHDYELSFLDAVVKTDARQRQTAMQTVVIDLVQAVQKKMKGFSLRETKDYYRSIMNKAWQEVEQAGTPEIRSQRFDEALEWTMLDRDFDDHTRRTFRTGPVFLPIWWGNYRPSMVPGRVGGAAPVGAPAPSRSGAPGGGLSMPHLPGSDFAASFVTGIQRTAGGLVTNLTGFTGGVTSRTNPPPPPPPRSTGGGWSSGGGGGHSCACACACAGCACACAGGGR